MIMKATKGGLRQALEFERLQAAGNTVQCGGEAVRCLNRRLYAVPGVEGVFRRVPRSLSGLGTTRGGACLATSDGTIVELVRDGAAEAELREAGFTPPGACEQVPAPTAVMPMERVEQQPTARERHAAASGVSEGAGSTTTPPEADGEGLTAAEILAEQRRQAPA
jgi:hypothetical protein